MASTTYVPGLVVPAVPPQPPQVTLLGSAVKPGNQADPGGAVFELGQQQLELLPSDLRAELQARDGDSWVRGFQYAPENQAAVDVFDPSDYGNDGNGGGTSNESNVIVVPYGLEAQDVCSTFGFEERDYLGRAQRRLENGKFQAVEREFWTGTLAQAKSYPNPFLADSNCVDITPTPSSPPSIVRGFQLLQDYLAQHGYGGQGMLHVQAQTATNLLSVRRVGKLMLDLFDNIVVPGVGYDGTGPVGNANQTPPSGQAWIYASDLVMVRESEPEVFASTFQEMTDVGQGSDPNTVFARARKFACAYMDGFRQAACLVVLNT